VHKPGLNAISVGLIDLCNSGGNFCGGHGVRELAETNAVSRKVTGSILDKVTGFFNAPNSSRRTVALGLM
jgi:hypothetical protein